MKSFLPLTLALLATPAFAEPIPAAMEAMIDAAASPEERAVVAGIAKKANPASAAEIDAKLSAINAAAAKAREKSSPPRAFLMAGAARVRPAVSFPPATPATAAWPWA